MKEREDKTAVTILSSPSPEDNFSYLKGSEAEEKRLYQKVFSPNIKRKPYKRGALRRVCNELVNSFFPTKKVSYAAMKRRLLTQFDRGNRGTVISYLGRPAYRQIQKMDQTVETQSGSKAKTHIFSRSFKAVVGYVEDFGLATLYDDKSKGETYFILHHTEQTSLVPLALPPSETLEESACSNEFSEALKLAKDEDYQKSTLKKYISRNRVTKDVSKKAALQPNTTVYDGEERETYTREINFEVGESNRQINNKTAVLSESNLSAEELKLFSAYDRVIKGVS